MAAMAEPVQPARPDHRPAYRHAPALTLFLAVALGVLAADLLSKHLAFRYVAGRPIVITPQMVELHQPLPEHDAINLVPSVLSLRLTTNPGAIFGIGRGKTGLFVAVSVLAVGVIGYVFCRSDARAPVQHLCLALILAGAMGNLYDRMVYGVVRDMLWLFPGVHLPWGWRWPHAPAEWAPWVANTGPTDLYPWIFNIADVALVVGVILMVILMWRAPKAPPEAPPPPEGAQAPPAS
jgi:signal peptidase II